MKRIVLVLVIAAVCTTINAARHNYVITHYGVKNDSTVVQTRAIQAVIDKAEENGGGCVVVPRGTFLSGALFFKPGTRLHLDEGAVLKGSDTIADFPLLSSRMEGRNIYYHAALVNAYHVNGFSITGPGTINGNGHRYWADFWRRRDLAKKEGSKREFTNLEVSRPRLVFIWGCDSVRLDGLTFCNSPFWTCHFYQCRNLDIRNCSMTTPARPLRAPSSDCIDLDVCSNVKIKNCFFNTDDDGVCLKGGKGVYAHETTGNGSVDSVYVTNCVFGPNLHGTVTLGSECLRGTHVRIDSCRVDNTCAILRLKMRPDTDQFYSDIRVSNITGRCGEIIAMRPWTQFFTLEGSGRKPKGRVSDIVFENIDVDCAQAVGHMHGNPSDYVSGIVFRNVKARAKKPFHCVYPDVSMHDVQIELQAGESAPNPDEQFEK